MSVDGHPAYDDIDGSKQLENHCDDDSHHDDDDGVMVAKDDRCPGDGTSVDYDQEELDSFDHHRLAEHFFKF